MSLDKVVAVTGASSGIGEASARELADAAFLPDKVMREKAKTPKITKFYKPEEPKVFNYYV